MGIAIQESPLLERGVPSYRWPSEAADPRLTVRAARRAFPPLRAMQQRLDFCLYLDPVAIVVCTIAVVVASRGVLPGLLAYGMSVSEVLPLALIPWGAMVGLRAIGAYDAAHYVPSRQKLLPLVGRMAAVLGVVVAVAVALGASVGGVLSGAALLEHAVWWWGAATAAVLMVRGGLMAVTSPLSSSQVHQVLVVGVGARAMRLYRKRYAGAGDRVQLLGLVSAAASAGLTSGSHPAVVADDEAPPVLGALDDLQEILARRSVDEVLIALPVRLCYADIQHALESCAQVGVPAMYIDDVFPAPVHRPHCEIVVGAAAGDTGASMMRLRVTPEDHRLLLKRAFDVVGGLLGILILSPVFVAAALAIRLTSRGPVIFTQERYGHNRRKFRIFKFRTMVTDAESLQHSLEQHNEADGALFKMRDDPRVTQVGRLLRRTSIDELPQLFNVVLGNMSLVGPRPLPNRDVEHIRDPKMMRRFSVLPGITGLWQVSGRSNLGYDECMRCDLDYIDRWSLRGDLRILARTIPAVLHGHGAA